MTLAPAGALATSPARQHTVIEINVECGQEGVEVVRHKIIFDALRCIFRAATRAMIQSDSVI